MPDELLVRPDRPCGTGVLVLAGSSGAVEEQRARLFAAHGALALSIRWFGGQGQQPEPFEVPIETFTSALDRMAPECDRLAIVGTSFGAEAALLTATEDVRVGAVVALAPSPVVWAGIDPEGAPGRGGRVTSHWTRRGRPVPFVPFDDTWEPLTDPPAYRTMYESSLERYPAEATRALIPVERIKGEVVVVAGEDDQVWPAADFARTIAARREARDLPTTVVVHPDAGHRVVLPGETPVIRGQAMARGGSDAADAVLGTMAWPHVRSALGLS